MRAMRPAVGAAIVAAALALSGCSMFGGADDPERDGDTGEITEAEDQADVFALRVGDCLNVADMGGEAEQGVATVAARPCGEAHDAEVYASTTMTDESFPGDQAAKDQAGEYCLGEFANFIGLTYDQSGLDVRYLAPTQETWEGIDDREILCIVTDPAGGLTATLAGAAR
jgi:hypothetical protein